ncbi:MAG TPA: DUF4013 domain-containing protein [Methanocorpusculum sp.]|nr:DUF4013 domain-containing protein [Methanocorpusculum sp.]
MSNVFGNLLSSIKFGFCECYGDGFKGFLRMLALLITFCIPIVFFIPVGVIMKILRGEKPDFTNAGQSFIRGLLFVVIALIYMLIPILLFAIFGGADLILKMTGDEIGVLFSGIVGIGSVGWFSMIPAMVSTDTIVLLESIAGNVGLIVSIVVAVLLGLVLVPAEINFVRNGFSAAFKFSEIFGMISKVGFVNYIFSYIDIIVFCIIVTVILSLIDKIPFVGYIAGFIALVIVTIPVTFCEYKFWANLFAE